MTTNYVGREVAVMAAAVVVATVVTVGLVTTPAGAGGADRRSRLDRSRAVVTSLRELLQAPMPLFEVSHRHIDMSHAVAIRGHVVMGGAEQWWPSAFEALDSALRTGGVAPAGPPGALFTADLFEQGQGEVVAFMPIAAEMDVVSPVERIHVGGGSYAVALHRGPYVDLDRTYGALGSYVAEHAIGTAGLIREHYLVGPR